MRRENIFTSPVPVDAAKHTLVFCATLLGGILLMYGMWQTASAFTEPPYGPPGTSGSSNTLAPLNEGSAAQTKAGRLVIDNTLSGPRLVDLDSPTNYLTFIGTSKFKGNIDLGGHKFINTAWPKIGGSLVNKHYVDVAAGLVSP